MVLEAQIRNTKKMTWQDLLRVHNIEAAKRSNPTRGERNFPLWLNDDRTDKVIFRSLHISSEFRNSYNQKPIVFSKIDFVRRIWIFRSANSLFFFFFTVFSDLVLWRKGLSQVTEAAMGFVVTTLIFAVVGIIASLLVRICCSRGASTNLYVPKIWIFSLIGSIIKCFCLCLCFIIELFRLVVDDLCAKIEDFFLLGITLPLF